MLLQGLDNVRPSFDLLSVRPSGAARVAAAAAAASLDSNRSALTYLLAQTTIYDGDRIDHGHLERRASAREITWRDDGLGRQTDGRSQKH